jgi:hypothetical protein
MADFINNDKVDNNNDDNDDNDENENEFTGVMVNYDSPTIVKYCPICSMPSEYCEWGPTYQTKCLPWYDPFLSNQYNHYHYLS